MSKRIEFQMMDTQRTQTHPITTPNLIKLLEAINTIDPRFRSGNSIPVEKATVPQAEWEAVRTALFAAFPEVFEEAKKSALTSR